MMMNAEQNEIVGTLFGDDFAYNPSNNNPNTFNENDEINIFADDGLDELILRANNGQTTIETNTTEKGLNLFDNGNGDDICDFHLDLDNVPDSDVTDINNILFGDGQNFTKEFENMRHDITEVEVPEIEVSNVVCKSCVGCRVDLVKCNRQLMNSAMHKKFPALFIRLKNPDLSILLFTTGNVVITGARTYEDACVAVKRLVKSLQTLEYNASVNPVTIENFVAKVCMGFQVSISELQKDVLHKRYCDQQTGRFPCVNYRIFTIEPMITVRVFGNGIFLIQSAKSMETLRKSVELMVSVNLLLS